MARTTLSLLVAASAACAAAVAFVPANQAAFTGRTLVNADGSRAFDWEGAAAFLTVANASYVFARINSTGPSSRFETTVLFNKSYIHASSVWVDPSTNGVSLHLVTGLSTQEPSYTIRVQLDLEPCFSGSANNGGVFTFVGWETDGVVLPPIALPRKIEVLGDSITAGYGSLGSAATANCPTESFSSSNTRAWAQQLCDLFLANCTTIAWSGKGMYENCCDDGETMPQYYLQTFGGGDFTHDWDFSRFIPDALVANLGTNDFHHDSGPAWEAAFSATFAQWAYNATALHYGNPSIPVFLAQGPMNNSPALTNALQVAINAINANGGRAYFLDLRSAPADGCSGHPGLAGHAMMATLAQEQIAAVMGW